MFDDCRKHKVESDGRNIWEFSVYFFFGTVPKSSVPNSGSMSTALSLYDAQGVLATLMETRNHTTCAICNETLGCKTYVICRFPDAQPGQRGLPRGARGSYGVRRHVRPTVATMWEREGHVWRVTTPLEDGARVSPAPVSLSFHPRSTRWRTR